MTDYIDRQAALNIAEEECDGGTPYAIPMKLENLPAADVVEVVRCKDCEHCSWLFDKSPLCLAGSAWIPITENDFCAWGKKRADNG